MNLYEEFQKQIHPLTIAFDDHADGQDWWNDVRSSDGAGDLADDLLVQEEFCRQ